MARAVPFHPSLAQQGVARLPRTRSRIGQLTAVGALLTVLSLAGGVVVAAANQMELTFVAWAQARRRREADRKLWALARSDPRLMAELVALRQHAEAQ
jgi:hypothetical protein